jgi:hypothetical protein
MITIVFGLPGSGKSTFARALASHLKADYINSDVIRNDINAKDYTPESKRRVYQKMLDLMIDSVYKKHDVIVDATFYKDFYRVIFKKYAAEYNTDLFFIKTEAKEETMLKRLENSRKYSDATNKIYHAIKKEFDKMRDRCLRLETDEMTIDQMLSKAMGYINKYRQVDVNN